MIKKATIVICTYNRAARLRKTLKSVTAQTYPNLEIIVVDNASTDNTESVVTEFEKVRYVFEKRQGNSYARSTGIEEGRGEYLAYIDDDETIEPQWLENMVAALERYDADMATGPVVPCYEKEPPCWMPRGFFEGDGLQEVLRNTEPCSITGSFGTGNSIFRKTAIGDTRFRVDLGRKEGSLISGEDTVFINELYAQGCKALMVPGAIVYHDVPAERISLGWITRRAFAEGVTEYRARGAKILKRRLHKPVFDGIALVISALTFDKSKICKRWLRFVQSCGVVCGWIK